MSDSTPTNHHFRLFSYLSISILSVFIILELMLVLQHLNEEDTTNKFIANQETLLQNQEYLKNISNELRSHEFEEMIVLKERKDISANNSDKLDQILRLLRDKP